jgi:hypothetical protein
VIKNLFKKLFASRANQVAAAAKSPNEWTSFKRYDGQSYWIIVANRNLLQNNQIVSMSWAMIEYSFLPDQLVGGMMPLPELPAKFYAFEDQVDRGVATIGGAMAASQTGFGTRKVWYCAPNVRLEDTLNNQIEGCTEIPVRVCVGSHQQFISLFPTELESHLMNNERIFQALEENGDDGKMERVVMHWIDNFEPSELFGLCNALMSLDYKIEEASDELVRFSRLTFLTMESAAEESENLIAFCKVFGCRYDGWETPIIKPRLH